MMKKRIITWVLLLMLITAELCPVKIQCAVQPAPEISAPGAVSYTHLDADVLKCIRMLTFLPLEQIDEMDKWEGSQLNQAKEILAYELTALVHGEEEAKKAQEGARALFSACLLYTSRCV